MSRRKQENPQPRKRSLSGGKADPLPGRDDPVDRLRPTVNHDGKNTIFSRLFEDCEVNTRLRVNAEPDHLQDILTCGVCQKEFALSDIVKFIQHKVHNCNKENCLLYDDAPGYDSELDPDEAVGIVRSRRTSISAPIAKKFHKESNELSDRLRSKSPSNAKDVERKPNLVHDSPKSPFKKQVVDADTNTVCTEPNSYTCSTCKNTFTSAWLLVQHVQNLHGLKIYVEPSVSATPVSLCSPFARTPPTSTAPAPAVSIAANTSSSTGSGSARTTPNSTAGVPSAVNSSSLLSGQDGPSASALVSSAAAAAAAAAAASLPQPLSIDPSTHPALQLLRMPLSERQFGPTTLNAHPLFARPPSHDFRTEILGDQFPRLNHHTGITPLNPFEPQHTHTFDRSHYDRTRTQPFGLNLEPQMDFYSQRLRQLAGATSPNAASVATTAASSPRKLTPPFTCATGPGSTASLTPQSSSQPSTPTPSQMSQSAKVNQPQQQQSSSPSSSGGKTGEQPASPKLKSCEYCGKSFRFQSNLIVHRRSHTGEKPYRCHICNHACTQASKLKRHMKTHQNKSPGGSVVSENTSVESARSTPDFNTKEMRTSNGGDDDASDGGQTADNEEEEEELDEEDEMEEEDLEEELEEGQNNMMAQDLTVRGPSSSTPVPSTTDNNMDKRKNLTINRSETRQSLLGEVMEKIGLTNIQQYSEAYKQALEESGAVIGNKTTIKQERPNSAADLTLPVNNNNSSNSTENGHDRSSSHRSDGSNKTLPHGPLDFGSGLLGAFDSPFDASKRMKLELERDRESLYAGLWLPSMAAHRDLYLGLQGSSDHESLSRHKSSAESALMAVVSQGGGTVSPRPGTSGSAAAAAAVALLGGALGKPKDRRNDTCEYCGKVFKNCSNLTVHRRSHTGEKPYKCELCSYACAQSSKLTRHMKTHGRVGKDVYRCRFCDMPFSVPSTLEKHMRKCVVNQNPAICMDPDSKNQAAAICMDSDSKELT